MLFIFPIVFLLFFNAGRLFLKIRFYFKDSFFSLFLINYGYACSLCGLCKLQSLYYLFSVFACQCEKYSKQKLIQIAFKRAFYGTAEIFLKDI
ncbi:hypothetical protein T07_3844 [Trichinella nelsoni]|uniref:Uncharacterized protein n=1 Tax=Trichinella nelsoni TaxID=6336 RepID=A0A0V0RY41_9BILA|nr:hypothetical protein T07_3844 [Trichinella nelsoni]